MKFSMMFREPYKKSSSRGIRCFWIKKDSHKEEHEKSETIEAEYRA